MIEKNILTKLWSEILSPVPQPCAAKLGLSMNYAMQNNPLCRQESSKGYSFQSTEFYPVTTALQKRAQKFTKF